MLDNEVEEVGVGQSSSDSMWLLRVIMSTEVRTVKRVAVVERKNILPAGRGWDLSRAEDQCNVIQCQPEM